MKESVFYRLPFIVMLLIGTYMIVQYYIPVKEFQAPKDLFLQWKQPLNGFIILLAIGSIFVVHLKKIINLKKRWGYSLITVVSMVAMIIAGFTGGIQDGSVFSDWFKYLISPIEATMFSLLAFFVASAAFRAFRARSAGAAVLLVSATIVMLAMIPFISEGVPLLKDWSEFILNYPNTAAKRAILIGVSLGAISVALKNIFGVDKTLLDRGEK
ncbi:MAG: hypothetical protein JXR91_04525 [Deltaproteobacteria bacterium]|nr:hypothetical protein [Deltaproteobacteria bacterium]